MLHNGRCYCTCKVLNIFTLTKLAQTCNQHPKSYRKWLLNTCKIKFGYMKGMNAAPMLCFIVECCLIVSRQGLCPGRRKAQHQNSNFKGAMLPHHLVVQSQKQPVLAVSYTCFDLESESQYFLVSSMKLHKLQ